MEQPMSDVLEAARAWGKSDDALWVFAEKAAPIVGRRDGDTALLAQAIKRSVDTVESYSSAWKLWETALRWSPTYAEHWRADLSIGHFVAVARKWLGKQIETEDALNYLAQARAECLSVEDLRKKLPGVGGGDWMRSALRLRAALDRELVNAPRLGVDETGAAKVARACRLVIGRIDRMKEAE